MPDDWDWFWAGEGGRDNLLRNEVEGLYRESSQARAQTARLSSQLAKVQGSMETRLSALAAAFDAYVELGDIRERLSGYPDTSAVRRAATAALETLTRGGVPQHLPESTVEYWLTDAVNALIARAAGTPDLDAEARAVGLDRDAELFVVAAAGALGHGASVGSRVPMLLVTDGALSAAQHALWMAVLAGEFGDILPTVREPWQPALDAADADWRNWAQAQARASTPIEVLRWIERQVAASMPGATTEDPARPQASRTNGGPVAAADLVLAGSPGGADSTDEARTAVRTALGAVALGLIQRGLGEEVALLERARELRARIESPDQARRHPADVPPSPTVLAEVRAAFLAAAAGSPSRAELLTWVGPGLLSVVESQVREAESSPVTSISASTPGGAFAIGTSGATADQRARAEHRVEERFAPTPAYTRTVPAVVVVVLILVVIAAGAAGSTTGAVLAAIGAVIALGVTLRELARERTRTRDLAASLESTRTTILQVETRVQQLDEARRETIREVQGLAAGLRDRLATPVG